MVKFMLIKAIWRFSNMFGGNLGLRGSSVRNHWSNHSENESMAIKQVVNLNPINVIQE